MNQSRRPPCLRKPETPTPVSSCLDGYVRIRRGHRLAAYHISGGRSESKQKVNPKYLPNGQVVRTFCQTKFIVGILLRNFAPCRASPRPQKASPQLFISR